MAVGADERVPTLVHATALIDRGAQLGRGVVVGPYSIVGPGVVVGDGTSIGPHVLVERDTELGTDCRIANGAVLGTDPQDLKYKGERTTLVVGDRTVVREYATINRGTAASGRTAIGSDCLLMAYTHVAHDCEIGNHVVLSNAVNMAGHVVIEDWVVVGGITGIHQFVRIGAHAFVGGASRITQDVPPYVRVSGNPPKVYGLNSVGLDRRGVSPEVRGGLKAAYRLLFQSGLNVSQGLERAEAEVEQMPEVRHLLTFIRSSARGITVA
ncbi:MAG: acyl-ACP--UDP-N-acetylglucosamine O-acyltransferase [Gemmatimonadetes bacterium]|nr:acyl-ACP--UDP-N-acetylglucosamine O-acyltransferase [Gemmatimonadota bacterium]